jgi:hypothetical protein
MKQLVINEELTGILHKCINDINNSRFEFNELVDKDFSLSKKIYLCNTVNSVACCKKQPQNSTMRIYYSKRFLNLSSPTKENIIMHEVIHTFNGCFNHEASFLEHMDYINNNLNYNVAVNYTPSNKQDLLIYAKAMAHNQDINILSKATDKEGELKAYIKLFCSTLSGKVKVTKFKNLIREAINENNSDKIVFLEEEYPIEFQSSLKYLTKQELAWL